MSSANAAVLGNGITSLTDGRTAPVGQDAGQQKPNVLRTISAWSELAASSVLILVLAWSQFPLGSNRPWAWSLLELMVALVWLMWTPSAIANLGELSKMARRLAIPGLLLVGPLIWATVQCASWTPAVWHNAVWDIVPSTTGHRANGAVSIDPAETAAEAAKLFTYLCAGFLAIMLARKHHLAQRILVAIAVIGVGYALYGLVLSMVESGQSLILEQVAPPYGRDVTGGFVSKNSFASFDGIALLVCLLLFVERAAGVIVSTRGWRPLIATSLQFLVGRGLPALLASIVLFIALVMSDSRAGLLATLGGLFVLFGFAMLFAARRGTALWAAGAGSAAFGAMLALFLVNGAALQDRFDQLVETRDAGGLRPAMWDAATQAIADHPLLGSGLGTFRQSYLFYGDRFEPYIIDRVHNDYLELALGLGIPMAASWILGLLSLLTLCLVGVLRRRRRRVYALAAIGASVLVGLHSLVDFSLQMPAVSLLFAIVLGVGLGQSWSVSPTNQRGAQA